MDRKLENLDIHCVNSQDSGAYPLTPSKLLNFTHNLVSTDLFENEALIHLLDNYPAQDIHVTTMTTSTKPDKLISNWRVGTTEGVSGKEILDAVRKGHLWLNVKRLGENNPVFKSLLSSIYQDLSQVLSCQEPKWQRATLLISSPSASVYYHADSIPNLLWHIRGKKTVFVYPHSNSKFAPQSQLELICSGEREEKLDYRADFEPFAQQLNMEPGQALLWPQNSPHRVVNTSGLNVSLSTEHITLEARQKVNLHRANRLLRQLGIKPKMNPPGSLPAITKQGIAICQSLVKKGLRKSPISFDLTPTFKVDPNADLGYREIK